MSPRSRSSRKAAPDQNEAERERKPRIRRRPDPKDDAIVASLSPDTPESSPAIAAGPAQSPRQRALVRELGGIVLLVLAVFLAGSLLFERVPVGGACTAATGPFGPVGGCTHWALLGLFGVAGAAIVPLIPLAHGLRLFGKLNAHADRSWLVFTSGLAILLPVTAAVARGSGVNTGVADPFAGVWGDFAGYYLTAAFGTAGAWCALIALFSVLAAVTLQWNPLRSLLGVRVPRGEQPVSAAVALEPPPSEMPAIDAFGTSGASETLDAPEAAEEQPERRKSNRKKTRKEIEAERDRRVADAIGAHVASDPIADDDELPPIELLDDPPPHDGDANRREIEENGARLLEALRTFRVDGELSGWTKGPTVTQYEVTPAPGVKVRQIATLSDDIALAMRAPSIRIVAPIPGRGAVGVEVPNASREMVTTRELLESRDYQAVPRALPIALGKDLEGRPVVNDLAKMPHLLIAGATGSGKSVAVNTIITSLIYRHTPETLRFLMVDPKMVELSVYNALPHLRHKVVTDNRDAAAVLKWAVMEMQQRYQLLAENGARNIQDFNAKVRAGTPLRNPKRPDVAFEVNAYTGGVLPYIVVVIDELADLMMTVQGEVEPPLAMLAQKARAIGIHLIVATQRPSVNVITGLIKANFPTRIAFRVASKTDSRTILDQNGADALLGNGDMLFLPPGGSVPVRIQGAYLPTEDTERLMGWYVELLERHAAAQGVTIDPSEEPDILEEVRGQELEDAAAAVEEIAGDWDELFRAAAEVCIQNGGGSTSLLQRRLSIGYGRAARIVDQLFEAGVLGPSEGSKGREVLVSLDDLDAICGGG